MFACSGYFWRRVFSAHELAARLPAGEDLCSSTLLTCVPARPAFLPLSLCDVCYLVCCRAQAPASKVLLFKSKHCLISSSTGGSGCGASVYSGGDVKGTRRATTAASGRALCHREPRRAAGRAGETLPFSFFCLYCAQRAPAQLARSVITFRRMREHEKLKLRHSFSPFLLDMMVGCQKLYLADTEGLWLCVQFAAAEARPGSAALSRGGPRPQQPTASPPAAPRGMGSAPSAPPAHGSWSQGHSPSTEPYSAGRDIGQAAWRSPPGSGALMGGPGAPQGSSGWGHAAWRSPPGSGAPTGGTFGSAGSSAGGTPPGPALAMLSASRAAAASMPDNSQDSAQWRADAWPAMAAADPSNSAWGAAGAADSSGRRRWDEARSPDPTLSPGVGAVWSGGKVPWADARSPNPDLSPGLGGTPRGAGAHNAYMGAWDGDGGGAPSHSAFAALKTLASNALSPRSAVKQQVRPICNSYIAAQLVLIRCVYLPAPLFTMSRDCLLLLAMHCRPAASATYRSIS